MLIDHHCHGVARDPLDRTGFESFLTESDRPPPRGCTAFDSLLGVAMRSMCGPVLELPAGADPEDYVARRADLGGEEANRRLLAGAGLEAMLVDSGLAGGALLGIDDLGRLSGASAREVVRLEVVAEEVAATGVGATEFESAFGELLSRRVGGAVGVKSIIAYRHGLDFGAGRPSSPEVASAAGRWLSGGGGRLDDEVLLRHVLWEGLATGLPLQLHTGFGDPDLDLARSDPALLTAFLRACADVGTPVVLLHCYPYHRNAAYLANVFPHVYLDVGLAIPHVGRRAAAILAEALELAPFHKLLYSSDAYGLAELYMVAAVLFREALGEVLEALRIGGSERARIAAMIGSGNARRLYAL
ncbi:MAG TPA: amidohydrolase family protein [Solirubrobacteraceae bacterium]|nr:amidohydrolase family protein [Solirubrobacteraceae bacterium]